MNRQKYTAAVIGTGRIGFTLGFDRRREQPASHTMALLNSKRIKLIAGCDIDFERRQKWQHFVPHAQCFSNSSDLYRQCNPDIIIISVNEIAHLSEGLAAIKQQPRLVILEKPVALTMEDALKIRNAAALYHVPVMVNHERRFSGDYRVALQYLRKIGSLQTVNATLCSGMCVYSKEREATGSYSLLHDGTHLVDLVHYILSSLSTEEIVLSKPVITGVFHDEEGGIRNFSAHYGTSFCPDVTIAISGRSRFFAFEIDLRGTEGRVCIGNGYAECYRRRESSMYTGFYSLQKDKSVRFPRHTGYFANMIQSAVDFLDGKTICKSTLEDAINDLAVLEEIKQGLQSY